MKTVTSRIKGRAALVACVTLLFLSPPGVSGAEERFGEVTTPPPQLVGIELMSTERAATLRQRVLLGAAEDMDEHHIRPPIQISDVPFAERLSENRQLATTGLRAMSTDVVIDNRIDVTAKAGVDHRFVAPIAEPSSAKVRNVILVTFNWGAVWSSDGGNRFSQLDPVELFGNPDNGDGLCCDQVALYVPSHDLLVWLMQGAPDGENGEPNTIRILVARGDDIENRRFLAYDFTPRDAGYPDGEWFDFPDLAFNDEHLFFSFNHFDFAEVYQRSTVFRVPLDQIASYQRLTFRYFTSDPNSVEFSPRFVQGSRERMFWATSPDDNSLVVRSWAGNQERPGPPVPVTVERYTPVDPNHLVGSEAPNGKPWLSRLDSRVMAGWINGETLGFMWSSGRIAGLAAAAVYPLPHVRVAILDRAAVEKGAGPLKPLAQPHIWSSDYAVAYPSAAPIQNGDIGLGMFLGGPRDYPSLAVGVLRKDGANWESTLTPLARSTNTPRCIEEKGVDDECGVWGDYLNVRPDPDQPSGWYVAGQIETSVDESAPRVAVTFGTFHAK